VLPKVRSSGLRLHLWTPWPWGSPAFAASLRLKNLLAPRVFYKGVIHHMAFRIKILVLLSLLLLFGVPFCLAQTLEEMRSAAEKISSIKGDFIQEKQMPILARPLIARGYFAYQRPASLRWEYQNPLQSVLLLHNGNVQRYLKSDNDWVEDKTSNLKSMEFILQEISKWLNGRFEDNPMFNVSTESDKKVIMIPKDKSMDQFIRRIELVMADQPGVIKMVTIFENNDSFTRFTFLDPQVNASISPVEFQKVQ
jgi:outer membrane lipoprotein-sorting protein